jgi:antitoxin HigA-1
MITKRSVKDDLERRPTHPGAIQREDILPALGLSVSEAARQLGVSRQTLHRILAERVSVTPEMAVRLGGSAATDPDCGSGCS